MLTAQWDSASTRMVLTARRLYIIFMMSYKEGEKSSDINVGVLRAASAWENVWWLPIEVGTSVVISAKGGGLASANEIFTVGCSVVGVAFEFLMSTDGGERTRTK